MKNNVKNNLYIFDCFGVVVSDVSTLWMNLHFNKEQQDYCRKQIFRKTDTAQITFDESMAMLAEMCGLEEKVVRDEWDAQLWLLKDTVALIRKIRSMGGTVALLSNASQDYIDRIFLQYDPNGLFHKTFVSSNLHCAKPDAEFYRACLNGFSQNFEKIYFTDDNPVNLVAAKPFGITTLLFTTAEQLEKDLQLE